MAKKSRKVLCDECRGLCCRYFALPIDTPENWNDYDDIRWFLCHKGVSIFVEDGDWYIGVNNKCRHLTNGDHRCAIYKKRPKICRGYKHKECDLVEGEYDYELHFTNDRQMEEYMKVKFGNNITEKLRQKKKGKRRKKK